MPDATPDDTLMADYTHGDERAAGLLFGRIGPRLRSFFLRAFGSPALADDLTQQTLLKVHQAHDKFRGDSPVAPWIFAIAGRVRLDELRRRMRLPRFVEDVDEALELVSSTPDDAGADASGVEALDRVALAARVHAALERLPESQRVVVKLHRFEGWTFAQIGRELGASEGAVRIRAFRAYDRLRVLLADLREESR